MRRLVVAMCVVALAGCTESNSAGIANPVLKVPGAAHLDSISAGPVAEYLPVATRLANLVSHSFGRVTLPADSFSLSSDAVHPDIACPPSAWMGTKCWIMYTPYKNGDASYENPAFLAAGNDTAWSTPISLKNPIVQYPGIGAYNSDPDHAFDPRGNRLVQVYRVVADSFNRIMIMSTANAKSWTPAHLAFKERNHDAVSPALVIGADRTAKMWYVRSGADGCAATSSSVQLRTAVPDSTQGVDDAPWSDPTPVNLSVPNSVVWHLDVAPLPTGGYAALVVAFTKGTTCGSSDLWIATSRDGIDWHTAPLPIFWRGMSLAKQRSISTWYRGTLRFDAANDMLDVWPSALAGVNWTIYHTSFRLSELMTLLNSASTSDLPALYASQRGIGAKIAMP